MSNYDLDRLTYEICEYLHGEMVAVELALNRAEEVNDVDGHNYHRGRRDELRRVRKYIFKSEEYNPRPYPGPAPRVIS